MPKRLRSIFSQLCHKHLGSSSKMELVMEAFCLHWKLRAHFQRFRWFLHGIWLPFFHTFFLGMCKRNNIFYQRNIRLMFGHVNNMCKRSNIFYERNIKLAFAYVNSMCKSSNIFYMNETSHLCSRTGTTCSSVAAYSVACHQTILFRPHPTPSLTLHYVGVQVPRNAISPIPPHPMLLILFYVSTQCFMHVDMYT